MNILHLTCSPRTIGSYSTRFSALVVQRLVSAAWPAPVVVRDLGHAHALPHADGAYAAALAGGPASPPVGSLQRSDELIAELEAADAVVIATPMHNYTLPSTLKAWVDHVLRIGRTFTASADGKKGALRDRPVYVVVASGGFFSGARARQPDFLTPYLAAAFATIGITSLRFIALEGTALGEASAAMAWTEALAELDVVLPAPARTGHGIPADISA